MYELDWSSIPGALLFLWSGMKVTLQITATAMLAGIAWGTLLAVMRLSSKRLLSWFAAGYVNLFRSIPLIMVLLWFFLIVPALMEGLFNTPRSSDTRLTSALVAFALFQAAYYAEIIRAGIQSVPSGQASASLALGMTYGQAMRLVILPQAFRNMTPLLLTQTVILFQDTSLVYVSALADFFGVAYKGRAAGGVAAVRRRGLLRHQLSGLVPREALPGQARHMISIRDVSKHYGSFQALKDCSTEVKKGEVIVVCGPSGSGKSTLIKCVNGLDNFERGEIVVNGTSVGDPRTDLPKLRAHVGMVFQHFELFPHMSITENLTIAQVKVLGRGKEEAIARGLSLLDRVGLRSQAEKYPGQLSGGQQQRVAIARALAMDPICMLFDEPTSALDPEMINEVLDVMVALAREGMTMMCVTHEMGFARKVAHRVVFMDQGQIVEDARTDDFFGSPRSERAQQFLSKILQH